MNYQLREITLADCWMLYDWRNSDRVRSVMINRDIIERSQHKRWFEGILDSSAHCYYVCQYGDMDVGVINFKLIDKPQEKYDWGFYLGEECPKGSGTKMCELALKQAKILPIRVIATSVQNSNVASIRIHEKLGFTEDKIDNEFVYLRKKIL